MRHVCEFIRYGENLDKLVLELCKRPYETAWVEFKVNNCNPTIIGQDISALANSAALEERKHSYMVWGVDDKTHELTDTIVRLSEQKKGNEELESWLRHQLLGNADFEMYSAILDLHPDTPMQPLRGSLATITSNRWSSSRWVAATCHKE